jgi:hypothetical protein
MNYVFLYSNLIYLCLRAFCRAIVVVAVIRTETDEANVPYVRSRSIVVVGVVKVWPNHEKLCAFAKKLRNYMCSFIGVNVSVLRKIICCGFIIYVFMYWFLNTRVKSVLNPEFVELVGIKPSTVNP